MSGRHAAPRVLHALFLGCAVLMASTTYADVPPIPARIGGTVAINGIPLTQAGASNYRFVVTRDDGTSYNPAAESTGLNASDWYLVDIPTYDSDSQPGGAQPGEMRGGRENNSGTERGPL